MSVVSCIDKFSFSLSFLFKYPGSGSAVKTFEELLEKQLKLEEVSSVTCASCLVFVLDSVLTYCDT